MTCRALFAVAALCAMLSVAGCSDRGTPVISEMDEPFYVEGVQLARQERKGEALTAFLKVIEKRGERGAPESHLEVASIYLHHSKDPVRAYYHFQRYLELQPNSKEAPRVRGMVDAALREIGRRFPGRPSEDQSVRLAAAEQIEKLRRENEELRAELQTLRGGGAALAGRTTRMISLPEEATRATATPPAPAVQVAESPIVPAPMPSRNNAAVVAPVPSVSQPATKPTTKAATTRATTPPSRPATTGRTHTVRQSEGLFAIARQFDSRNPGAKMREIIAANPDVLPQGANTPLKPGMVLRIP